MYENMFAALNKIAVLLLFIFVFLQICVSASRREFPTCRSRDTCVRLINCVPYMNLIKSLKKPLSRASVLFLRKQECGFDGMYPMVCCFPSNTRRTSGNRNKSLDDNGFPTVPPFYILSYSDNPEEEFKETYQPMKKPDLASIDLNGHRSAKDKNTKFLSNSEPLSNDEDKEISTETSKLKTTTEKFTTTTRLIRRKVNNHVNKVTLTSDLKEQAKNKRAQELKRKMEAINNAFMYSTMDYFFVRRMDDENRKDNNS